MKYRVRSSEIELREILTGREPVIKLRTTGRVAFEMAIATFLIDAVIIIGNATRRRPRHASGLLGRVAGSGLRLQSVEELPVPRTADGALNLHSAPSELGSVEQRRLVLELLRVDDGEEQEQSEPDTACHRPQTNLPS